MKIVWHKPHYENEAPFKVPVSWEWTRLCDITALIEDCPHSTAKDEGSGYPLIRTPNVGEGHLLLDGVHRVSESVYNMRNARAIPETNDIIYAREAPAGNAAVIKENEKVCLGQRTVLIRPFKEYVNSNLLAYFIISPYSRNLLISTAVGSTATHVNLENIRPFTIPLPPFSEQLRIVSSIEKWFDAIEALERDKNDLQDSILKAKTKILDLAIHGKLVSQDPNDEPAIELLKRINPSFVPCDNAQYQYDIPDSWEWVKLLDIAISELGKTLDKGKNTGIPYNYLCAFNVKWHSFDLSVVKTILLEDNELERYKVRKGDLLICEGGDVGRAAIWESNDTIYYQNALHRVRFKDAINQYYFLYVLQYYKSRGMIDDVSGGVTIKHFTQNSMKKLSFPLPPKEEQKRIVAKIEDLFAVLDEIQGFIEA